MRAFMCIAFWRGSVPKKLGACLLLADNWHLPKCLAEIPFCSKYNGGVKYLGPREDIWKWLEDFYVCEVGENEMGGLFAKSYPFKEGNGGKSAGMRERWSSYVAWI